MDATYTQMGSLCGKTEEEHRETSEDTGQTGRSRIHTERRQDAASRRGTEEDNSTRTRRDTKGHEGMRSRRDRSDQQRSSEQKAEWKGTTTGKELERFLASTNHYGECIRDHKDRTKGLHGSKHNEGSTAEDRRREQEE